MYTRRNFATISLVNIVYIVIFFLLIVYVSLHNTVQENLQLRQVVILSRHNVRSPLSHNLVKMSPHEWPKWEEAAGLLTAKGYLLEGFMGTFFSEFLRFKKLLNNECPTEEEFFVHASSKERTITSAEAFIKNGFSNCNITIHHSDINESDPIFSPFIHNSSRAFKKVALSEMKHTLNNLHLNRSYTELENILDYKQSEICKVEDQCDMTRDKNKIDVIVGNKPKVTGPLKTSNEAVDAFLMAFYNGFEMKNIAWGKLDNLKHWINILQVNMGYHNVVFNTSHVAQDIAKPLIKYMTDLIIGKHKVVLLMGHDANINVILNVLNIKPFKLKNSFSQTPVGGKVVFQKWFDVEKSIYFLKIDYVYQSNSQLRDGKVLSLENPPRFHSLQLNDCNIDEDGYCLWDDFIALIKKL